VDLKNTVTAEKLESAASRVEARKVSLHCFVTSHYEECCLLVIVVVRSTFSEVCWM
jgi:hypothetical protein